MTADTDPLPCGDVDPQQAPLPEANVTKDGRPITPGGHVPSECHNPRCPACIEIVLLRDVVTDSLVWVDPLNPRGSLWHVKASDVLNGTAVRRLTALPMPPCTCQPIQPDDIQLMPNCPRHRSLVES